MERLFAREFFSDFSKSLRGMHLRRKIIFGSEGKKKGRSGYFGSLEVRGMSAERILQGLVASRWDAKIV
jgi:hypothetical protein